MSEREEPLFSIPKATSALPSVLFCCVKVYVFFNFLATFSQKSETLGGKSEIFGNYIINKLKDQ